MNTQESITSKRMLGCNFTQKGRAKTYPDLQRLDSTGNQIEVDSSESQLYHKFSNRINMCSPANAAEKVEDLNHPEKLARSFSNPLANLFGLQHTLNGHSNAAEKVEDLSHPKRLARSFSSPFANYLGRQHTLNGHSNFPVKPPVRNSYSIPCSFSTVLSSKHLPVDMSKNIFSSPQATHCLTLSFKNNVACQRTNNMSKTPSNCDSKFFCDTQQAMPSKSSDMQTPNSSDNCSSNSANLVSSKPMPAKKKHRSRPSKKKRIRLKLQRHQVLCKPNSPKNDSINFFLGVANDSKPQKESCDEKHVLVCVNFTDDSMDSSDWDDSDDDDDCDNKVDENLWNSFTCDSLLCVSNIQSGFGLWSPFSSGPKKNQTQNEAEPEEEGSPSTVRQANEKWQNFYGGKANGAITSIKVSFASDLYRTILLDDANIERKGPWEQYARDRERFKNRINEVDRDIGHVFSPSHRMQVYRKLISNN